MNASNSLDKSFVLLAGSISHSTPNDLVDRAHAFVDAFVETVLNAGGGFVVYVAAEPVNAAQKPLLFDWAIARTIERLIPGNSEKIRLKIVAAPARLATANEVQQRTLNSLIARNIAELIPIDDDTVTGGNVGDEQIEVADVMVALGGGKGVLDRARKMAKRSLPVLPLDLQLGANCEDGAGAIGVLKNFQSSPLTYMPHTGTKVVKSLPALSLQIPVLSLNEISDRIVKVFDDEEHARRAALPPDVLVLTALDIELAAAKQAFGIAEDTAPTVTGTGLLVWKAPVSRRDGKVASCLVASFAGAGNVDAASITSTLLTQFKPGSVVMMGIAAGMRDKCKLGEVVLGERVVAYEGAAVLQGGKIEPRPEITRLSLRVRQDIGAYLSNVQSLESRLTQGYSQMGITFPEHVEAGPVADSVKPKLATIASGEWLLRDPDKFRAMREYHGKVEAAEMEAAGVFAACGNHNKPVLLVRGISDFGDALKDNRFHALAAKAAAVVTADYIANGLTLDN